MVLAHYRDFDSEKDSSSMDICFCNICTIAKIDSLHNNTIVVLFSFPATPSSSDSAIASLFWKIQKELWWIARLACIKSITAFYLIRTTIFDHKKCSLWSLIIDQGVIEKER